MKLTTLLTAASALAVAACATSEPPPPPIDYQAVYTAALTSQGRLEADLERDAIRKPVETLSFMDLKIGDTVVEMEAGGGYFTPFLASVVGPEGQVYMQNPAPFSAYWEGDLPPRFSSLPANVSYLESDFDAMRDVPSGSVDVVTWFQGPHELWYAPDNAPDGLGDPSGSFAEIYRVLAPGGRLYVIDHVAPAGAPPSTGGDTHRIDPNIIYEMATSAGLRLGESSDMFANPLDNGTTNVFAPNIRGNTDQFFVEYVK